MPKYVRIQRQRAVLKQRVKVPAAVHQFTRALRKDQAVTLFSLLAKYRPETKQAKKLRLQTIAANQAENKETKTEKPKLLKYGLNNVTKAIEKKRAKLVIIAHDVNPIELVVFLPSLCRKNDVQYCIVHNKSRLGYLVHKKQCAVVAVCDINAEDQPKLQQLMDATKATNAQRVKFGGLKLSTKTKQKLALRERKLKNTIKAKGL
jgi:large subunit ribosomal protein L7Ae